MVQAGFFFVAATVFMAARHMAWIAIAYASFMCFENAWKVDRRIKRREEEAGA